MALKKTSAILPTLLVLVQALLFYLYLDASIFVSASRAVRGSFLITTPDLFLLALNQTIKQGANQKAWQEKGPEQKNPTLIFFLHQ